MFVSTGNMKRTISILLTTLVLLAVIRPTLVFHYCGSSLRYVKILAEASVNSCCPVADESTDGYMQGNDIAANEYLFSEFAKSCCSSYIIGISADDFKLQQESKIERVSVVVNHLPLFSSPHSMPDDVDRTAIGLQRFSPGGTFNEGRELLSLICAFLI